MPLIPAITVSNNNITASTFTVTDTSTGSDVAIASRLVYIYDDANNLLTGAPIQFPLSAGASISPAILTQDQAYNIVINWNDAGGNILYTLSQIGVFTGFLESFYYTLTQMVAAKNNILNDTMFLYNYSNLRNYIDSASQAITYGSSIYNSQSMILLAQDLQTNQNLFY